MIVSSSAMRIRLVASSEEPQGCDGHPRQRGEPVELGGDERRVIGAGEDEREPGGEPPGTIASDPGGRRSRSASGPQGMRPSAVRHSPLKSAEVTSGAPEASTTAGKPAEVEAATA